MRIKHEIFAEICYQLAILDPGDNTLYNATDHTVKKSALGEILVGVCEEFAESSSKQEILAAIFWILKKNAPQEPLHVNSLNDTVTAQALAEILDGIQTMESRPQAWGSVIALLESLP